MPNLRMALQLLKERLRKSHRLTRIGVGVIAVTLALYLVLPWGQWAGQALRSELASRGIMVERFDLRSVSLRGAKFKNVQVTSPIAMTIPIIELKLSTVALLQANWPEAVSQIAISAVPLRFEQNINGSWSLNDKLLPKMAADEMPDTEQGWQEELMEQLSPLLLFPELEAKDVTVVVRSKEMQLNTVLQLQSKRTPEGFSIAASAEPLTLTLQDGQMVIPKTQVNGSFQHEGSQFNLVATMPQLDWQKTDQHGSADLLLNVNGSTSQTPSVKLTFANVAFDRHGGMKLSNPQTTITVTAHNADELLPATMVIDAPAVQLENVPAKLTALNAQAVCSIDALHVLCNRLVASTPTRALSATGMAGLGFDAPEKVSWTISGVANNVLGGRVRFEASAPANGGFIPSKVTLMADRLGLQEVLSMLAEGKINATGSVSGQIPLSWHGGSDVRFGHGVLRADGVGSVSISPELLAMDNPQVAMVSGILQDFRYEKLSISLSPANTKKGSLPGLKATLSTLGKNPTKLEGHPVKLNVNLSGDLLSLLKQSILPMSDPEQWLQNSN